MILRLSAILLFTISLCTCDSAPEANNPEAAAKPERHELSGEAMGSYYRITYLGDSLPGLRTRVDSLLHAYNFELSAWVPESKLSQFNRSDTGVDLRGTVHFLPNLLLANTVSERTGGAYDPTIAPLVRYWGFGGGKKRDTAEYDPEEVKRLRALVGLENITVDGNILRKKLPGVQLDLNASAKGYGVDLLSSMLSRLGRPDHLIDVGGEMRGGGSKDGQAWNVAIRLPDEDKSRVAQAGTLPLRDGRAIATSGNYLNYYKVGGETFSHTINPATGMVERNRLLSASILAPTCATADAYATACMVLGPERALALVEQDSTLEGYFLVRGEDGELLTVKSGGIY